MLKSLAFSIIVLCLIFYQAHSQYVNETLFPSLPFTGNITGKPVPVIINIGQTACPRNIAFVMRDKTLGNTRTFDIVTEDVDLDSDNDILMANYIGYSQLWLNDGNGAFTLKPPNIQLVESARCRCRRFKW
ncbi:MAG: VCBS repeat-containing protein [candidate division Zixibacteria bacterium]|nr:VCBS repeat-containing protein [candidate division Zixibacteria bacterium]